MEALSKECQKKSLKRSTIQTSVTEDAGMRDNKKTIAMTFG